MVPFEMLSKGTRVKIVDQWVAGCRQNSDGGMNKYLGKTVTIHAIMGEYVLIEEDTGSCPFHMGGHWYWYPECFDYIVEENFEPASDGELVSFLFGGCN